jgi:hypothetical protein
MMGSLWWLIVAALTIVPMWKLLERGGINPIWSLVSITGIGLVILLWILAFRSPDKVA